MSDPAWLAAAPPDATEEALEAEVVEPQGRQLTRAEKKDLALKSLEDDMLQSSLNVVGGAIDFVELDPDDLKKVPEHWIEEYGEMNAKKRHRAALAGLMSAKEAPVGIKVATQMAVGTIRARATERAGPRSLNITAVQFVTPRKTYEEVEVDE